MSRHSLPGCCRAVGKENTEGTPANSCSITSTSENYKIILWLASG